MRLESCFQPESVPWCQPGESNMDAGVGVEEGRELDSVSKGAWNLVSRTLGERLNWRLVKVLLDSLGSLRAPPAVPTGHLSSVPFWSLAPTALPEIQPLARFASFCSWQPPSHLELLGFDSFEQVFY